MHSGTGTNTLMLSPLSTQPNGAGYIHFIYYLTVWGVEPIVTRQTSWLGSTGVCGVRQNQAGGSSV